VWGESPHGSSGSAVSGGDINGDTLGDIIIGAPSWAADYRGRVDVFYGREELAPGTIFDLHASPADLTITGAAPEESLGTALVAADLDGDWKSDLILGAPSASRGGESEAGAVYILFGSDSLPGTVDLSRENADVTILGNEHLGYLGYSLSAGDVNGDGIEDVIAGAPAVDGKNNADDQPKVHVFYGRPRAAWPAVIDLDQGSSDITVIGDPSSGSLGCAVSTGDVNGDGLDDIIAGAVGGDGAGKIYVVYGSASFSLPRTVSLPGEADLSVWGKSDSAAGCSVASADFNGDAVDDLFIGAPYGEHGAGVVYGIYGSSVFPAGHVIKLDEGSSDIEIRGEQENGWLGSALAAGELTGEAPADLIIGAPGAGPAGRAAAGEVYLISGQPDYPPHCVIDFKVGFPDYVIEGRAEGDRLGSAVSATDFSGEGIEDLLLGAPRAAAPAGPNAGQSYVIYGEAIDIPVPTPTPTTTSPPTPTATPTVTPTVTPTTSPTATPGWPKLAKELYPAGVPPAAIDRALDRVRDDLLIQSAAGKELTRLMYTHAGEIAALVGDNAELKVRVYSAGATISRIAGDYLDGGYGPDDIPVPARIADECIAVVRELGAEGSPALKADLKYVEGVANAVRGKRLGSLREILRP
jgi:hypothetical protein